MAGQTPLQTVEQLIEAINGRDVDQAVALYEPDAAFVVEPGKVAIGTEAIKAAFDALISLNPTITTRKYEIVEAGGTALYYSDWSMNGAAPDGTVITKEGKSTDVLRRNAAGDWLISIDNPSGVAILG